MLTRTYVWVYNWIVEDDYPNKVIIWEDSRKFGDHRDVAESVVSISIDPSSLYGFKTTIRNVTGFLVVDGKVFAARPNIGEGLGLYISDDGGDSFRSAKTPAKLKGRRYTILDATPGSVFVNAQEGNSKWGKIYVSNEDGSDFSLSLKQNPRTDWGGCDFARIRGIHGMYLGNNYTRINSGTGSNIQTYISYSEGASWRRLNIPCNGTASCYLNLLGNTDSKSLWFSKAKAPGIFIGVGNVGQYLNTDIRSMNTYITLDAGQNWKLLASGSHKYYMDNTGSLLLMAINNDTTNEFKYTWDMGDTWHKCSFPGARMMVEYIIPVPNRAIFIILGKRGSKNVALTVNIENSFVMSCTGFNYPDEATSDFEYFSPPECINGRSIYYVRRKPKSSCIPPPDADTEVQYLIGNCRCAQNDYQCDFCFSWNNDRCVLDREECPNYDPTKKPADCKGIWYEPSGYRLVPGDTCDPSNGVQHPAIKHNC